MVWSRIMISFKGRHFPQDIILMSVRWKLAYPLSYRNIEEMKRNHSSAQKWVVAYSPQLEQSFRTQKKTTGMNWRMDETYLKVSGKWVYLYRSVDKEGKTVDFMVSKKRDRQAVLKFFKKAIGSSGMPEIVAIDKSGSNESIACCFCMAYGTYSLKLGEKSTSITL